VNFDPNKNERNIMVIPPDEIRVISFRKANDRERKIHEQA
jgi:uncharacterized DUF497 family protein